MSNSAICSIILLVLVAPIALLGFYFVLFWMACLLCDPTRWVIRLLFKAMAWSVLCGSLLYLSYVKTPWWVFAMIGGPYVYAYFSSIIERQRRIESLLRADLPRY